MKEDGARRRAFETLLFDLYRGSPQLRFRHDRGTELADFIWKRFGEACFNCGTKLVSVYDMHLDHTRPLALLWPLDESATALCGTCNSEKRDRSPRDFYTDKKLHDLSRITGISIAILRSDAPNNEAIAELVKRREWFFDEFLVREEMTKERDGKIVGELVVKALKKVMAKSKVFRDVDLVAEYNERRRKDKK
jgi:urease gamma subunit